ncbi:MAG TPA: hypothetical protein VHT03_07935 [Rhizomicrobium sp.]|nr:hypothetical protein [Rhizomicrobium sp.]
MSETADGRQMSRDDVICLRELYQFFTVRWANAAGFLLPYKLT